jgi:choline kinase
MSNRHTKSIRQVITNLSNIDVLIPVAGLGKRMKSYGPKALIPIKYGQSILQRQLSIIDRTLSEYRLTLVCGFEAEKIIENSPEDAIKVENELYNQTNVVRSVGLGLRSIPDCKRLLLLNGDLVFSENAISSLSYDCSSIIVSAAYMSESEVGCIVNSKNHLEHMMYDLPDKWGQIVYLQGKELDILKRLACDKRNKKLFTFEVINKIIEEGGIFRCIDDPSVNIMDVDTSKDIKRAKEII